MSETVETVEVALPYGGPVDLDLTFNVPVGCGWEARLAVLAVHTEFGELFRRHVVYNLNGAKRSLEHGQYNEASLWLQQAERCADPR